MALLEWKNDYKTGFASIDYEHEHLILAINSLFAGTNLTASSSVISVDDSFLKNDAVREMVVGLIVEERLVARITYPGHGTRFLALRALREALRR